VGWLTAFGEAVAAGQRTLLDRYRLLGTLLTRLTQMKTDIEKALTAKSPLERYDDVDPKLREKWEEELAASVEAEYRRQRTDLLLVLQWWLRDVWLQTLKLSSDGLSLPHLVKTTQAVAQRISTAEATENLQVLERMQRLLYTNVQEALAMEVNLLKLKL